MRTDNHNGPEEQEEDFRDLSPFKKQQLLDKKLKEHYPEESFPKEQREDSENLSPFKKQQLLRSLRQARLKKNESIPVWRVLLLGSFALLVVILMVLLLCAGGAGFIGFGVYYIAMQFLFGVDFTTGAWPVLVSAGLVISSMLLFFQPQIRDFFGAKKLAYVIALALTLVMSAFFIREFIDVVSSLFC